MFEHLAILPILIPVVTAALLLLPVFATHKLARRMLCGSGFILTLFCALALASQVQYGPHLYQVGNWPAPFGIVLFADRIAATLVTLTSALLVGGWLYSCGRDDTQDPFFNALLHFLLMGINGAFLTGDLFNLFVF